LLLIEYQFLPTIIPDFPLALSNREGLTKLEDTKLEDTKLEDTKLEDTKLEGTKLEGTKLKET
jgi:uncharacterized protein YjbI with pentapeptide repeats